MNLLLGKSNDLAAKGASAEDSLKIYAAFPQSRDYYDQRLYEDAATRVVFKNCFEKVCELDHEQIPHFNKNFYYN